MKDRPLLSTPPFSNLQSCHDRLEDRHKRIIREEFSRAKIVPDHPGQSRGCPNWGFDGRADSPPTSERDAHHLIVVLRCP